MCAPFSYLPLCSLLSCSLYLLLSSSLESSLFLFPSFSQHPFSSSHFGHNIHSLRYTSTYQVPLAFGLGTIHGKTHKSLVFIYNFKKTKKTKQNNNLSYYYKREGGYTSSHPQSLGRTRLCITLQFTKSVVA
jgi:hypothetical protein